MIKTCLTDKTLTLQLSINDSNSLDSIALQSLLSILYEIEMQQDIERVIVTGNARSFCKGANIDVISEYSNEELLRFFYSLDSLLYRIYTFSKPVIAKVTGHAIGGGLAIMLASDFSIVEAKSRGKFGFPEYRIGMSLTPVMRELVINRPGLKRDFMTLGRLVDVNQANTYGFFTEFSDADIDSCTANFIKEMQILSLDSFGMAKRQLYPLISKPDLTENHEAYSLLCKQFEDYKRKHTR